MKSYGQFCPVAKAAELFCERWTPLIVRDLAAGAVRFSELQRAIEGISQRMLTLTLRQLERDGLVLRTVYPTVPPRVEYALTPLGRTLLETVTALAAWAESHRQDIESARIAYDQRAQQLHEPAHV